MAVTKGLAGLLPEPNLRQSYSHWVVTALWPAACSRRTRCRSWKISRDSNHCGIRDRISLLKSVSQSASREHSKKTEDTSFRNDWRRTRPPRRFGSPHLAETALQLIEPMGSSTNNFPRVAIVRWLDPRGNSYVLTFGPEAERSRDYKSIPKINDIYDVISSYKGASFFQIRAVKRDALVKIALAIQK